MGPVDYIISMFCSLNRDYFVMLVHPNCSIRKQESRTSKFSPPLLRERGRPSWADHTLPARQLRRRSNPTGIPIKLTPWRSVISQSGGLRRRLTTINLVSDANVWSTMEIFCLPLLANSQVPWSCRPDEAARYHWHDLQATKGEDVSIH